MYKAKIFGAGSIGNHLAHACRSKEWDVLICDVDPQALQRTKNDIFPERYGCWDDKIRLSTPENCREEMFDIIIVGTPPDTHMDLAIDILKTGAPKVLLIEKPLCTPSLKGCLELYNLAKESDKFVGVGYNHTMTQNSQKAAELLESGFIGRPQTLKAVFREHWGGIFSAHPWLDGPGDSYLGFYNRGGGASGEHSHAINIWQHFANLLGMGRIIEVSAMMDLVDDGDVHYDRICQLNVKTEKGLIGNIVQDVITKPSQKSLRIQGSEGFLEWHANWNNDSDSLHYCNGHKTTQEILFPKTRPDDFIGEIDHIENVLKGKKEESPISLEQGLQTMLVIAAAHISNQKKQTVKINYEAGYCLEAIHSDY